MKIAGGTKLLGIIGQNIAYTRSPTIHNAAIKAFGLDQVYVPFDIENCAIPQLLEAAWHFGALGFSVTKPHKVWMAQFLKSPLSSVNTLYRGAQGWQAAATDGAGFIRGLQKLGINSYELPPRIVFLGFGGAVAGILEHFSQEKIGLEAVAIVSRSPVDLNLARKIMPGVEFCNHLLSVSEISKLMAQVEWRNALLVQASSAPQQGDDLTWLLPGLDDFTGTLVDLCYGTQVSGLLDWAKKKGLRCQDGIPMLIEQARKAQELWWGRSLDYEKIAMQISL